MAAKLTPVAIHDQADVGWQLGDDAARRIFNRLMAAGRPLGEVVEGRIYYGVKTGFNEAFIVNRETRDRLVMTDPGSTEIIKPVLNGEDVRSWHFEDEGRWLLFVRRGTDIDKYPAIREHLEQYREVLEPRPVDWNPAHRWPGRKPGPYRWFEIQDTVAYHAEFEGPKLFWPEMAKQPRFTLAPAGLVGNKTTFMIPGDHSFLLGILMSRSLWFVVSHICVPIGERAGMLRYMLSEQFMSRLPIPAAPAADRDAIAGLALTISEHARARYAVHRQTRHRILTDLGAAGATLNQKLTAWWELDFPGFLAEVRKALKREIPVRQRDDWEGWLADQRAEHVQRTVEIVRLETQLNQRVYELFDLTAAEVKIIEESTKYRYGEV